MTSFETLPRKKRRQFTLNAHEERALTFALRYFPGLTLSKLARFAFEFGLRQLIDRAHYEVTASPLQSPPKEQESTIHEPLSVPLSPKE